MSNSQTDVTFFPGGSLLRGVIPMSIPTAPHAHKLIIPVDQSLGLTVADWGGTLSPGTAAFVGTNICHTVAASPRRVVLFFEPEINRTVSRETLPIRLEGTVGSKLRDFAKRVLDSKLTDESALESACVTALSLLASAGLSPAPPLHPRVEAALEWLRQPWLKLDHITIAKRAGVSPDYLSHKFREQIGMSCKRYVLWIRTLYAVEQMGQGVSATEASQRTGFSDLPHFTRSARRFLGVVPTRIPRAQLVLGNGLYRRRMPGVCPRPRRSRPPDRHRSRR